MLITQAGIQISRPCMCGLSLINHLLNGICLPISGINFITTIYTTFTHEAPAEVLLMILLGILEKERTPGPGYEGNPLCHLQVALMTQWPLTN